MDLTAIVVVLVFIGLVRFLSRSDPPRINGIYAQPNKWYWLKFRIFKIMLWLRKREQHKKVTGENAGMGRKSRNSSVEMDRVQILPKEYARVSVCSLYYIKSTTVKLLNSR